MKFTAVFAALALVLPSLVNAQISASACRPDGVPLCCGARIPASAFDTAQELMALLGSPTLPTGDLDLDLDAGAPCLELPGPLNLTSCPVLTTPLCCAITSTSTLGLPPPFNLLVPSVAGANCQTMTFP